MLLPHQQFLGDDSSSYGVVMEDMRETTSSWNSQQAKWNFL